MEAERAAREKAAGAAQASWQGPGKQASGWSEGRCLSAEEREVRDRAQRKLAKALATAEARAKVRADPHKLPTTRISEAHRYFCQYEQLGLPCPTQSAEHWERNCHRVCAYCFCIGHPLWRCEMAAGHGVVIRDDTSEK